MVRFGTKRVETSPPFSIFNKVPNHLIFIDIIIPFIGFYRVVRLTFCPVLNLFVHCGFFS